MANKVAILTGASAGIGEAAARSLAREGFTLVLAARRADKLEALAKEIEGRGGRALAVPTDLASEEETRALVRRAMEAFGRIDLLVNNAGYGKAGPLELLTRDDARRQFEVNLFATLQLCAEVAPIMRAQGGGRILNVSSGSAKLATPMVGLYCATKGALELATDALRVELAPWNIDVVLVLPGTIATEAFVIAQEDSAHLLADTKSVYHPYMLGIQALLNKKLKIARPPAILGDTIARAAVAPRPKVRYIAPWEAWLMVRLVPLIPARWIDRLLIRAVERNAVHS
ncbi:MAG: SDR family NAD(P)-dependent oxidoreductase [Myxococcales bacterium]|nr:SDR family NAD(P)-dependent oxidoreductase [Myxococcales bacterium]